MPTQKTIAVLLFDRVNAVDIAGPLEAFACVRHGDDRPAYRIVTWAIDEETVGSESGLRLCADRSAPSRPHADTLIVPGGVGVREPDTLALLAAWLRRHHEKFRRIASVCTGAYALAEAGLLDGRKVATHWAHAADLQKRHPKIDVDADALFLKDGRFCSSGGVTAGIDLALDLIDADFGADAAMKAARELVVFLRRPGAQAQFSVPLQMQAAAPGKLGAVCTWAASNLDADLSVDALAARAGLSARQFARQFRAAYGAPPASFVARVRLDAGRTLLGQGLSVAQAAHAVGFASANGFRRAFERRFGVSPSEYQHRFRSVEGVS